jgi:hypothetical protein
MTALHCIQNWRNAPWSLSGSNAHMRHRPSITRAISISTSTLISLPKTVLQLPCDWVLYYLGCLQRITLQNIALLCKILIPSWSNLSMMKHACQQWWRSSILTLSATSQIALTSELIINCFISLFSKLQAAQQPIQTAFHFFKSSN